MKISNKILMVIGVLFAMTSCYEQPGAPVDDIIGESLGSIPSASDYTWVGDDPAVGGQVSFTFNFWSDTDIQSIDVFSSLDGGVTLVKEQTNAFSDSGYSEFYNTDTIAYTLSIPAGAVAGSTVSYLGVVTNTNGNTAERGISFDVQ